MVFEIIAGLLFLATAIFFVGPAFLSFVAGVAQLLTDGIKAKVEEWRELFTDLREAKEGRRND